MFIMPGSFDGVKTVKEFKSLEGPHASGLGFIDEHPNCCFLHPSIFLIYTSMKGTVGPRDLAVKIIKHCCRSPGIGQERSPGRETKKKNTKKKKKEDKRSLTGHAHGVLYFLWKLANSTGAAVNLKDPPDHESVVSEMDSRTEALKEWFEIARQKVEEENLGRKPPARERSAGLDNSEDSAEIPEESPEPEEKERIPAEGKSRFSFRARATTAANIKKKAQPSSPPDDDQSLPSSDKSVPERTIRKKARGLVKLPQPKLVRKGPKKPLPRKREEQRTSRKGEASRSSNLDDYPSASDSDDCDHGGGRDRVATIVPPNADRRAADPLPRTGGKGPGIGVQGTTTKMTTGTDPGGGRWQEEVMEGTHQVHPPLPIDPPRHRRRDPRRRRSRSSSRDQSGSDHSVNRSHKNCRRSQSSDRGGGGGRRDRNQSRSRSRSPRGDNDRRGGR
jgi:hypothetical protein